MDSMQEQRFRYLSDQEREERGERRGLEQRAAGLLGVMLIAFPVASTVAKDADPEKTVSVIAFVLLTGVFGLVVFGAHRVIHVLSAKHRDEVAGQVAAEEKLSSASAGAARKEVARALRDGRLEEAADLQEEVVTLLRTSNRQFVDEMRTVTDGLLYGLVVLVVGVGLLIWGQDRSSDSDAALESQKPTASGVVIPNV